MSTIEWHRTLLSLRFRSAVARRVAACHRNAMKIYEQTCNYGTVKATYVRASDSFDQVNVSNVHCDKVFYLVVRLFGVFVSFNNAKKWVFN